MHACVRLAIARSLASVGMSAGVQCRRCCEGCALWRGRDGGGERPARLTRGAQGSEVSTAIAENTLAVNYYGVQRCLRAFDACLRPGARVIVVSSRQRYGKLTDEVLA
jgi:hypothetical protein